MFERLEFAKLSVVGSAKELQKHIETTYPDSSEYEGIIPRLKTIVNTDILSINSYKNNRQLPYGSYSIEQAYCPDDIRYGGFSETDSFVLDETIHAAVPIHLTFEILDEYKELEEEQSEAPSDAIVDNTVCLPSESEGKSLVESEQIESQAASENEKEEEP